MSKLTICWGRTSTTHRVALLLQKKMKCVKIQQILYFCVQKTIEGRKKKKNFSYRCGRVTVKNICDSALNQTAFSMPIILLCSSFSRNIMFLLKYSFYSFLCCFNATYISKIFSKKSANHYFHGSNHTL
jgi:hypothetical protein